MIKRSLKLNLFRIIAPEKEKILELIPSVSLFCCKISELGTVQIHRLYLKKSEYIDNIKLSELITYYTHLMIFLSQKMSLGY